MAMIRRWLKNREKGQIMIGFYVGIMAVMGIMLIVATYFMNVRSSSTNRQMKDMALEVARAGFEEGLSYFQRQPSGVYLPDSIRPSNDYVPATGTTFSYPDDAFRPLSGDTDIYISVTTGTPGFKCTAAIIRDFPLQTSRTVSTSNEPLHGTLWGRYVIKRQVIANWSPGGNTLAGYSDPEAAHDITLQKDFSGTQAPGAGLWWGLTSRGYVYLGNGSQSSTGSDDISATASTVYNSLTSSPLATYNNRTLLLATAKVYGELYRVSINTPPAAVYAASGVTISGNGQGYINAGTNSGTYSVYCASSSCTPSGGVNLVGGSTDPNQIAPSVSVVFPGMTKSVLQGQATSGCFGDVTILPDAGNSLSYTTEVATTKFYYLHRASSPNTAFVFNPLPVSGAPLGSYCFNGTGLIFVDGDLSITADTQATWSGIVFVDGNCYLNGPASIQGQLICTHKIYMYHDPNKPVQAEVDYEQEVIDSTKLLIENFQVYKPSVVTSYN
jgi:hypothetical protein